MVRSLGVGGGFYRYEESQLITPHPNAKSPHLLDLPAPQETQSIPTVPPRSAATPGIVGKRSPVH